MQKLSQLVDSIIDKLGFDRTQLLREEVKDSCLSWFATLIRQDVEKNGMSNEYNYSFVVPLEKVDYIDNCLIELGCTILKTTKKIPHPIRFKGETQFKFVGTADKSIAYTYVEKEFIPFRKYDKFANNAKYFYENNYIYVVSKTKLEKFITIEAPFLTTDIATTCENTECLSLDDVVSIPVDMCHTIEMEVVKMFSTKNFTKFPV